MSGKTPGFIIKTTLVEGFVQKQERFFLFYHLSAIRLGSEKDEQIV